MQWLLQEQQHSFKLGHLITNDITEVNYTEIYRGFNDDLDAELFAEAYHAHPELFA